MRENTIKNSVFLLTGSTGYVGSRLLKYLRKSGAVIMAVVRDVEKAKEICRDDEVIYIESDVRDYEKMAESIRNSAKIKIDYIIHCAAPTKSSFMVSNPVETVDIIVTGTKNMLEIARETGVKSFVNLSSMEVYGDISCVNEDGSTFRASESQLGAIDISNARSSYPLAKRIAEHYCYAYYKEYGVPVKTARLAQTFGAGVLPQETRIFAEVARSIIQGKDIVLHTPGVTIGNYVGINDTIEAIMTVLLSGANGESYNVVNEKNTMTVRDMIGMVVREIGGGSIQVLFDIPDQDTYGYAVSTGLRLSAQKISRLGWAPRYSLKQMFESMIEDMKSNTD